MGAAGEATSGGTALIVAADREDRRVLFDVLDAQGFEAIYSARDLGQARGFFGDDPAIDLVVLEFDADPQDALEFCATVRARAPTIPIVGVLGRRRDSWPTGSAPAELTEWIAGPIRADDATARIQDVLSLHQAAPGRGAAPEPSPDRYRFAFDGSADELAVVDPANGGILETNDLFVQRSGHARPDIAGGRIDAFDLVLSERERAELQRQLAEGGSVHLRGRKPHADGSSYPVDMHACRAVQDGQVVYFYRFREIGELVRHREALAVLDRLSRSSERGDRVDFLQRATVDWLALDFAIIVEASHDQATTEFQPLAVYHRFAPAEEGTDPWRQACVKRVLTDGSELVHLANAWRHCGGAGADEHRFECVVGLPLVGESQAVLGALLVARRAALEGDGVALATLRVIAHSLARELELRRTHEQGRAIGLRDPLTGMPNRLLFNDRLNSAILEAQRTSEMFAVVFVDLDRFKNVNDSLGHTVGDQVLTAVAKRLAGSVRAMDTVARYAGDEFTLILRHIVQREDVERIAEKIVRAMEAPLQLSGGLELNITASLGISFYPDDATDAERLLKHADVAMYSAKGMGRSNYQAYVAVPEESHRQRLALEAKLRQAEKNDELRVFYQPQVDSISEDIVGMEALIRWEHPELGMISPGFFIPLAEESGLIIPIGEWILRAACRDAHRWQLQYGLSLRVGVNLSPLQLRQPNFARLVDTVLKETGLDPRLLDLEITESISMNAIPNLLDTLRALRELGCSISIDDFGTGQSSLDYIKRFPAERIKIDQAFVRNIGVDPDDEAIVEATITMAHNLNRKVVAEGVEIEQHLEFLRDHGCDVLQGFLFCRPVAAAGFENLLQERARLLRGASAKPFERA